MNPFASPSSIQVNGADLHFVDRGTGDSVVFVHGGGATDFRTWGAQIDPFAQEHRVVAYSLRYHYPNHHSGLPADYSLPVHAQDLAALIVQLKLAPAHVVASSYGGDIALLMTRDHPELVKSLVLAEPALTAWGRRLMPEPAASNNAADNSWAASARAAARGEMESAVRLFADRVIGEGAYDRLPEAARRRMLDNAHILALPETALLSDLACEDVGQIQAPTLILTGEGSPARFRVTNDELARCMRQAERATIPNASHYVHGMNPAAFNESVLAFLARH